jgi:signal transduction histidine kinase
MFLSLGIIVRRIMDTPSKEIARRNTSSGYALLRKGIHFAYVNFFRPKSLEEDNKRREFILNIILLASILLSFILTTFATYYFFTLEDYDGVPLPLVYGITLFFIALYVMSRKGLFILSSYILIGVYLLNISYAAYQWGPNLPMALLGYAMLIIIASVLISTRFAFILTISISALLILLGYLQVNGITSPSTEWRGERLKIDDTIEYAVILLVIMTLSWLSNREIERSLARARKSEAALKEQRDLLELTVEARTRELQQAQAEKISQLYRFAEFGRMASGLFHDLMNPMTAVTLYLEQLNKVNVPDMKSTQLSLHKAFEATQRMEQFAKAMRKQLQRQEIHELFSLNEAARQAVQLLTHKADQMKVQINIHGPADITLYDNPLKFHQILVNLISNAIDAYYHVPSDAGRKREVLISLLEAPNDITVIVQDWGAGIAQPTLGKIFDPFFTTKEADKGMGIGLSTTKDIIEKNLGGSITVQSQEGEGTTFRVTIPKRKTP